MKHCLILLAFTPAIWLTACTTNPLEPDLIKSEITNYYKDHQEDLVGSVSFEPVIIGRDSGSNNILFRTYINGGLLKHKEVRVNENADSVYYLQVTEKGKPFTIKETISAKGYPVFVLKTFEYYFLEITEIKYSPDKKEAVAFFTLAIRNLTPWGERAADRNHKRYQIAVFKLDEHKTWKFDRITFDPRLDKVFGI